MLGPLLSTWKSKGQPYIVDSIELEDIIYWEYMWILISLHFYVGVSCDLSVLFLSQQPEVRNRGVEIGCALGPLDV